MNYENNSDSDCSGGAGGAPPVAPVSAAHRSPPQAASKLILKGFDFGFRDNLRKNEEK